MVAFVDVPNLSRLVRRRGLGPIMQTLAEYLDQDFGRWRSFDLQARVAVHSPSGVVELMPINDGCSYAFKYVNGHPGNPEQRLQTVTAFGALANMATGYPVLICEMTVLTAIRTAATSAWAATKLARPHAENMAMIGLGAQAEFQAVAFQALLGIRKLQVHDVDAVATAKFVGNLGGLPIEIVVADSVESAAAGCDIITTCTADKVNAQVLRSAMIEACVHINAIGGDCPGKTELDPAILRRADVFVEYAPQTRIEGEIQQLDADFPVTEMWEVVDGRHPGRVAQDRITVFDSVGFALEDYSALRFVQHAVAGTDLFTDIHLVADPVDPKDLFALIHPVDPATAAAA